MSEGTSTQAGPQATTPTLASEAREDHEPFTEPNAPLAFRRRRIYPLLGPALASAGTLLSAYVVLGDLVVHFRIHEWFAALALLGSFLVSAWLSGKRSLALSPATSNTERRRLVAPGLFAFGLACAPVLLVSLAARTDQRQAESRIVLFLVALGFAAMYLGHHLSGPNPHQPPWPLRSATIIARGVLGVLIIVAVARALTRW
jgi:hypothetical protein